MKTKHTLHIILAFVALQLARASDLRIEVRCLEFSGTLPSDAILTMLVEDEGAQASKEVSKKISENGSAKIEAAVSYAYPKNSWHEGGSDKVDSKSLIGWSGEIVTSGYTDKLLNLKFDLTNKRLGSPHIHEANDKQIATPVFRSDQVQSETQIELGSWRFWPLSPTPDKKFSRYFAIRVIDDSESGPRE